MEIKDKTRQAKQCKAMQRQTQNNVKAKVKANESKQQQHVFALDVFAFRPTVLGAQRQRQIIVIGDIVGSAHNEHVHVSRTLQHGTHLFATKRTGAYKRATETTLAAHAIHLATVAGVLCHNRHQFLRQQTVQMMRWRRRTRRRLHFCL